MKAKTKGTCQCCGRVQKLPGDRLAKHGYTTRWGFFSGVCRGSGYLPFELSTDQVARYVRESQDAILGIEEDIAGLASETSVAWVNEYVRGAGYRWIRVNVFAEKWRPNPASDYEAERYYYHAAQHGEEPKKVFLTVYSFTNLFEVVKGLNDKRINLLRSQIADHRRYIAWQQERIANWAPSELATVV